MTSPSHRTTARTIRSTGEASIIPVSRAPGSWKTTLARQLLLQPQRKDSVLAPVTRYILGDHEAALAEIDPLANQEWEIAKPTPQQSDSVFDPMRAEFRAFTPFCTETGRLPESAEPMIDLFKSFESLKESLGKLRVQNAILDGEIICIDGHGISQFNQLFSRQGTPVFYAFDLLWLNHEDLRNHPLIERKERLRELIERNKPESIIYAQPVECCLKKYGS